MKLTTLNAPLRKVPEVFLILVNQSEEHVSGRKDTINLIVIMAHGDTSCCLATNPDENRGSVHCLDEIPAEKRCTISRNNSRAFGFGCKNSQCFI